MDAAADDEHRRDLDRQMRGVVTRLALTSNGITPAYSPVASKAGHGSKPPASGDPRPPHLHFAHVYAEQTDDVGGEQVLGQARRELEQLTRRVVPAGHSERGETPDERRERLLSKGAGIPLNEAAAALNCSPRELSRERKADGRDTYEGRPLPDQPTARQSRDDRAQRAREMRQRGLNLSQIAAILRVDRATVRADLRRA